jgi:hypothetical protein
MLANARPEGAAPSSSKHLRAFASICVHLTVRYSLWRPHALSTIDCSCAKSEELLVRHHPPYRGLPHSGSAPTAETMLLVSVLDEMFFESLSICSRLFILFIVLFFSLGHTGSVLCHSS